MFKPKVSLVGSMPQLEEKAILKLKILWTNNNRYWFQKLIRETTASFNSIMIRAP